MGSLIQDLRHAARTLARRPGLALAVVLTLGPGLGGTIAVFDLVNLLDWQQPPVARPGEVVALYTGNPQGPFGAWGPTSYSDYLAYRDAGASFTGLVAETGLRVELSTGQVSAQVGARALSGNFFEVLGVPAAYGRTLQSSDDRKNAEPVAMLGFGLWQRMFGADPEMLGDAVELDGQTFTIVGVVPERFTGTRAGVWDLLVPVAAVPRLTAGRVDLLGDHKIASFNILGRLRPGVATTAAKAEIQACAARLDQEHPLPDLERRITVAPASKVDPSQRRELTPALRLLALAMVLLLLISCANVAHLLLARARARRREAAIRRALGADRPRLLRQLLTETWLLAMLGGLWGLCLAFWARSLLTGYIGDSLARELRFDHRVLGLGVLTCLVVTVLCGLVPALTQARTRLVPALKSGAESDSGRSPRFGSALAVGVVALSALLLASTGLVGRSLWNMRSIDLGIDTEGLVYATVWGLPKRLPDAGRTLYRQVAERAAALPGVTGVGRAQLQPPVAADLTTRFRLPGEVDATRGSLFRFSRFNVVDGGYFETLGIPLLAGRFFDRRDAAGGRPAVVVNRQLADELWPDGDVLGRTIVVEPVRPWDPGPELEVVGVVGSTRQHEPRAGGAEPDASEPILYFSYEQRYRPILAMVLRTEGDPSPIMTALRNEVLRLDPAIERLNVRTFDQHVWDGLGEQRLLTQALAIFAVLGWFLAVVGVAGVMSYSVSRQTHAIGIRMALGARGEDILAGVLGRGLRLTGAGLVIGLAGSLAATPLLRHLLFGVTSTDPAVQVGVALVILTSAALALYLPARRASRVDPLRALREE